MDRGSKGVLSEPAPANAPTIRVVFSVDDSRYLGWQAELLAYSHRKIQQPGSLTRLWSSTRPPTPFPRDTFWTEPYSPHPITGDEYVAYNKPAAIQQWSCDVSPPEETILLLDPDCVFLSPLTICVERGRPISQRIGYLLPGESFATELVSRHCRNPALVQGLGIPTLIHRDDLRIVAPLWLAKTEAIRSDRRSRKLAGWPAEMWAYAFAAAELGLRHELCELAASPADDRADLPIVHYCYDAEDPAKQWSWSKRTYQPWELVPNPPNGTPQASMDLISLLNEWAATQQFTWEL